MSLDKKRHLVHRESSGEPKGRSCQSRLVDKWLYTIQIFNDYRPFFRIFKSLFVSFDGSGTNYYRSWHSKWNIKMI